MLPMRIRLPLLLWWMVGSAAGAQTLDEASLAAKRSRSPVDPQLAAFAGPRVALRGAAPVDPWPVLVRDDGIVLHAASNGDARALLAELEAIGLRGGAVSGNAVSGVLPFDAVEALESLRHLAAARPAMATPRVQPRADSSRARVSARSRGPPPARRRRRRHERRHPGRLVRLPGRRARAGHRRPATCRPRSRCSTTPSRGPASTRAARSLEIAHDVAPRSRLGFHTAFNGQADFAEGIRELARDFAADVIVDDVIYFDEPFFQDGVIARAVSEVHAQGVAYFRRPATPAAGPRRAVSRQRADRLLPGARRDAPPRLRSGPGVDVFQTLTLPPFSLVVVLVLGMGGAVRLRVDGDPTLWAPRATTTCSSIAARDADAGRLRRCARALGLLQPRRRCARGLPLRNTGPTPLVAYVAIERFKLPGFDGPDVDRMKLIDFAGEPAFEWSTGGGGTAFGHANARGAIAVGAAAWFETPAVRRRSAARRAVLVGGRRSDPVRRRG